MAPRLHRYFGPTRLPCTAQRGDRGSSTVLHTWGLPPAFPVGASIEQTDGPCGPEHSALGRMAVACRLGHSVPGREPPLVALRRQRLLLAFAR